MNGAGGLSSPILPILLILALVILAIILHKRGNTKNYIFGVISALVGGFFAIGFGLLRNADKYNVEVISPVESSAMFIDLIFYSSIALTIVGMMFIIADFIKKNFKQK